MSEYEVSQSPVTKLWYVRDADTGEVFEERETKQAAELAARRRQTQAAREDADHG